MVRELLLISVLAASAQCAQMPKVDVAGDWKVQVSSGKLKSGKQKIKVKGPVILRVEPADVVRVEGEKYDTLPVFNEKAAGWIKGARLKGLITFECTATDLLVPHSLGVFSADGNRYKRGVDYEMDDKWATFGRLEGGSIAPNEAVYANYTYGNNRLDTMVVNKSGKVRVLKGTAHPATPKPPKTPKGSVAIANIWVPGRLAKLTEAVLYPIIEPKYPEPKKTSKPTAQTLLPKTWEKLTTNQSVNILAWGDSVTAGGQASDKQHQYQYRFADMLQKKFPNAKVNMITCAWGGRNSSSFLNEPSGSPYNFEEKVLGPRPDLIVMEFVNDSYMSGEVLMKAYSDLKKRFDEISAEWIIVTPHYVRPDWMGEVSVRVETDKRPYTLTVREFAKANNVALADASLRWGHLLKEGIPYTTLLSNSINHPDDQGHEIFALSIMELFGGN